MSGIQMRVNSGVSDQVRRVRRLRNNMKTVERVWPKVGRYISREVAKQFRTRGVNFGTPWKPLAPSTVAEKRRLGFPRAPLVRSGRLKREFTGRPLDIERYQGNRAFFGSNNPVALWQHKGTRRNGRRHIPPRTIIKTTPKMRREIKKMFEDHLFGRS